MRARSLGGRAVAKSRYIRDATIMTSIESEVSALESTCAKAVDRLLARHTWRLLAREELIRRACVEVVEGRMPDPRRAAVHVYSLALYEACSGAEGEERQSDAYAELFRYLFDLARWRYPDVGEDAAQRAIEVTWLNFGRCRQPGAFLAFAIQHLMDAARATRRVAQRQPLSLDISPGLSEETLGERVADERQPEPVEHAIVREQRQRLEHVLDEFLHKHPRAAQQIAALRLKYLDGLDERTISETLGKSIQSIYVLRSRAIEKLRHEPTWRAIASEFGILSEEA
jgi:RNA polymerase sigma factor (sigma-70 family)